MTWNPAQASCWDLTKHRYHTADGQRQGSSSGRTAAGGDVARLRGGCENVSSLYRRGQMRLCALRLSEQTAAQDPAMQSRQRAVLHDPWLRVVRIA